LFLLVFAGCNTFPEDKDYYLSQEISFNISSHIFAGENISSIFTLDENNYWYSVDDRLVQCENSQLLNLKISSRILSITWNNQNQTLWFGTSSSGLGQLKKGALSYYTKASDNLPRDLVSGLVCEKNGQLWFNCSAHQLGGLGCFHNGKFKFYTPENSELPDNLIKSIAIRDQTIYVATGGTVEKQKVLTISNNKWKLLPVTGYYLMNMDVARDGTVYVIDDAGLSSSSSVTNKILEYKNGLVRDILPPDSGRDVWPHLLKTDLRNYLWVSAFCQENRSCLTVFDGEKWHEVPSGFPDIIINCITVDTNNNIWLGTSNGIYILSQETGLQP
jgi:ligand-binding sensor domain-containing protein